MPTFMDDLDVVDPNTVESTGPLYPVAQWHNGEPKLAAAGGVVHLGGLIIPTKYVDDSVVPPAGWLRTNVAFSSGKSEQVLAGTKPRLAVVRTRFRWFIRTNGVETYYPRAGYVANSNMRGHVQALCGIHGFDFPVIVTFKGKASQEFETLLREFSTKTGEAAAKLARAKDPKARFPRFAFYMPIAAGPHVKAGQKGQESIITPPVLGLPEKITDELLGKLYVGRERLLQLQQLYLDSADWALAWDNASQEPEELTDTDPDTGEITPKAAPEPPPTVVETGSATLRPFTANVIKAKIEAGSRKHAGRAATPEQRGLLVGILEYCYPGSGAEEARHLALQYLTGEQSSKRVPDAFVLALLDWLKPAKDNTGAWLPDPMAEREAALVLRQARTDAGQVEMNLAF